VQANQGFSKVLANSPEHSGHENQSSGPRNQENQMKIATTAKRLLVLVAAVITLLLGATALAGSASAGQHEGGAPVNHSGSGASAGHDGVLALDTPWGP
jgi:hypothetical protein